jgi:hypothetical protein
MCIGIDTRCDMSGSLVFFSENMQVKVSRDTTRELIRTRRLMQVSPADRCARADWTFPENTMQNWVFGELFAVEFFAVEFF